MGNRKARDFQLRQEQQASWDRLRLTPWSPDSVGRAWKSGRPRVQIIRFPSFSQCSFFEVCELAGEWLLYQSEIVEPWPVASVRGYDLVPFDSQTLAAFVADLTSIAIPAAPPVTGRAGLDGVTTQIGNLRRPMGASPVPMVVGPATGLDAAGEMHLTDAGCVHFGFGAAMTESPYYRFYRRIKYPLPFSMWRRLPRLLTHKNEYWDGHVRLSPRPRTCNVRLSLVDWKPPIPVVDDNRLRKAVAIRKLADGDWQELPEVFHSAFGQQQPLYSWKTFAAARASRAILKWTQLGRDGLILRDACFVAVGRHSDDDALQLCGCAVVTLTSLGMVSVKDPADAMPHPEDPSRRVIPHLTWMFVSQCFQRCGIGTMLLGEAITALRSAGFAALFSTFTFDDIESVQWHWKNGFRLSSFAVGSQPARRLPG